MSMNKFKMNASLALTYNERKTARIEIVIQPTLKALAKKRARERNEDMTQIITKAIVHYLAS